MRAALVLIFAVFSTALAQQGVPPAPQIAGPGPSLTETSLAPAYTIKSGTQLVIVDVSVKDKKGNKIHGLKASDFILKESGKPQAIRNFEEHTAASAAGMEAVPQRPTLAPGEFTNLQLTPPSGALNIILVDQVNTALKDQLFMREQLTRYLKGARPDARTAIFSLNNRLVMLQGFTSDPALLLAAIQHKASKDSVLRDDTSGGPTISANSSTFGAILSSAAAPGGFSTGVAAFEGPQQAFQADQRAYVTLDALNDLARFLVNLPGRKNLIWFAGDFPPNFFPSENSFDGPYAATAQLEDEYRDTVNLLSRSQVAVYPVDAQGLRSDQSNSAGRSNASYAAGGASLGRTGSTEQAAHLSDFNNTAGEHMAMNQIAHDTGGQALYDHNDLARMVKSVVDDGAEYYTLAYVPSVPPNQDSFRSINVHVEAPGASDLSYRRGYYTDKKQRISSGTAPVQAPATPMQQALRAGAPPPSEVLLRTRAYPLTTANQPTVLDGNQPNPNPKVNKGPYRVYKVDGAASIQKFSFTHGPDNIFHTTVDFVTYVYDVQGNLINAQSNSIRTSYTKAQLAEIGRSGLRFGQQVSVPARGDYFLRVAVRDATSGNVGALEIPVAAIANLQPPIQPGAPTLGPAAKP